MSRVCVYEFYLKITELWLCYFFSVFFFFLLLFFFSTPFDMFNCPLSMFPLWYLYFCFYNKLIIIKQDNNFGHKIFCEKMNTVSQKHVCRGDGTNLFENTNLWLCNVSSMFFETLNLF